MKIFQTSVLASLFILSACKIPFFSDGGTAENSDPIIETKSSTWAQRFPAMWNAAYASSTSVKPEDVTYEQFLNDLSEKMVQIQEPAEGNVFAKIDKLWNKVLLVDSADTDKLDQLALDLKPVLSSHPAKLYFLHRLTASVAQVGSSDLMVDPNKLQYLMGKIKDMYGQKLFKLEYLPVFIDSAINYYMPFIHDAYHPDVFTGLVLVNKSSQAESGIYADALIAAVSKNYGHTPDEESPVADSHMSQYSRLCYLAQYAIPVLNLSSTKRTELTNAFSGKTASTAGSSSYPRCTSIQ